MLLDNHVVNINHEVDEWLISFNQAISTQISKEASIDLLYKLFFNDSHWRDLLALTWKIQTISGNENIIPKIYESIVAVQARSFSIDIKRTLPREVKRADKKVIEVILTFETEFGKCEGIVRLYNDIDGDGIQDLLVGARYDNSGGSDKGAVWVLFLDTNGTVKWHQKIAQGSGGLTVTFDLGDMFGTCLLYTSPSPRDS